MRCVHCRQSAQIEGYCVSHAMRNAVQRNDDARAYAIAKEHDRPESAVRVLIRKRGEDQGRAVAEAAIRAGRALPGTPTMRVAVAGMREGVRDMLVAVNEMPARAA